MLVYQRVSQLALAQPLFEGGDRSDHGLTQSRWLFFRHRAEALSGMVEPGENRNWPHRMETLMGMKMLRRFAIDVTLIVMKMM